MPKPLILATAPVAPFNSVRIPVEAVVGDQNVQNSFIVSSDGARGQVLSTLRSTPEPGGNFVEIPREDRKKATDRGQHPWIADDDITTYLVLFTADKSPHTAGVSVYTDKRTKASNGIAVDPNQTKVLDLGTLSERLTQPEAANDDAQVESRRPHPRQQGIVT